MFRGTSITNRKSCALSYHFFILSWLITIVWAKTWKISYLRKFSSQVTQIVSSAHLPEVKLFTAYYKSCSLLIWPFYGLLHLYDLKFQKSNIFVSAVHKYHKKCSQLYWPFFGLLQLYEVKLQKSHISVSSVHIYRKSCSLLIWPFYGLLQLYEVKIEKSSI